MATGKKKNYYSQVMAAVEYIRGALGLSGPGNDSPRMAIILGSGLGDFVDSLQAQVKIPFSSVPYFPTPSVAGHPGMFVYGRLGDSSLCCLQGRVHYYEGYEMKAVTFPVRVLGVLGIKRLIITNAAGGLNPNFRPGDLMMFSDHISSFLPNPLVGRNEDVFGPRFPDMSDCYSVSLRHLALRCGRRFKLGLQEGTYAGVTGPSYETPAEIKMLRKMGADAVGMSTVPEVIVARHMGMECLGISVIANLAAGISRKPLSHREVLKTADRVKPLFTKFLAVLCGEIFKLA
jgi:purine-nucleoside phosphorylase